MFYKGGNEAKTFDCGIIGWIECTVVKMAVGAFRN